MSPVTIRFSIDRFDGEKKYKYFFPMIDKLTFYFNLRGHNSSIKKFIAGWNGFENVTLLWLEAIQTKS